MIPEALPTDTDDVAWALQTARSLWQRGETLDALNWLRRAVNTAAQGLDSDRTRVLMQSALHLESSIASTRSSGSAGVEGGTNPTSVSLKEPVEALLSPLPVVIEPLPEVSGSGRNNQVQDIELANEEDFDVPIDVFTMAEEADATQALPAPAPARVPVQVPARMPAPVSVVAGKHDERTRSVRVPSVVEQLPDFVANIDPSLSPPVEASSAEFSAWSGVSESPRASASETPPPNEYAEPASQDVSALIVQAGSEPPAQAITPTQDPLPASQAVWPSSQPPSRPPSSGKPSNLRPSNHANPNARDSGPVALPSGTRLPVVSGLAMIGTSSEPPQSLTTTAPASVAVRPSPSMRAPDASAPEQTHPGPETLPRTVPNRGSPSRVTTIAAFADMSDDARQQFVANGVTVELGRGDEMSNFGLVCALSGQVYVQAMVADKFAATLGPGDVLRCRGTIDDSVALRIVGKQEHNVVLVWSHRTVEERLASLPWVEELLRTKSDDVLARVGMCFGSLGDYLDQDMFDNVSKRLRIMRYDPEQTICSRGEALPGIVMLTSGAMELVHEAQAVTSRVGVGDVVLREYVVSRKAIPLTLRAGPNGAVALTATHTVVQELITEFPIILEHLSEHG